jgi:hypothetical protein
VLNVFGLSKQFYTLNMEAESYSVTSLPTELHGVINQETVINRLYDRDLNAVHAIGYQKTL